MWGVLTHEKDPTAETACDELTSPYSLSSRATERKEGENSGIKLSPRRREKWGEKYLKIKFFISHYLSQILIGSKLK